MSPPSGRVIGGLFLSGFLLYGGGTFLIATTTGDAAAVPEHAASLALLSTGATLLLLNSAAVATIGALAFPVLRRQHRRTATVYLATRTVEAVLLALAPLGSLILVLGASGRTDTTDGTASGLSDLARDLVDSGETAYWTAMATLGVGSVLFCRALLRSGLLPRLLAGCGMAGYAIFALGSVLELSGYRVGLAMSIPGGLFEVAGGSYLLAKGFRGPSPTDALSAPIAESSTSTLGLRGRRAGAAASAEGVDAR